MEKLKLCAPCLFGLESIVANEVKQIGGENVTADNGKVVFFGDVNMIYKANLWIRCAERVLIELGSFKALTFEHLFEGVRKIDFSAFINRDSAFPVKGWSLNSKLTSVPACQSIIKKAVVKSLEKSYKQSWFEETGKPVQIQFSILKDTATIYIDTSGAGLHKRGYRPTSNEAPIKETLAAGIISLARLYEDSNVYDPFCGSGTFAIEAAMKIKNIAPGLHRSFAFENLKFFNNKDFQAVRREALDAVKKDATFTVYASDIDKNAVMLTMENARRAGVVGHIKAKVADVKDFYIPTERGVVFTNPPYGERLLDVKTAEELYKTMGQVFTRKKGLSYYVISPHEEFESFFGQKADKRRKLYNGMIKCQVYMYFKGE
jgi:putative N6-adenine-specific DNA methylase